MSSSNLVKIIAVPETEYGKTPTLATAIGSVVRHVSEGLSGTPTTAESAEARSDRMSGGQVVVGLESGGEIAFELSSDDQYDEFFGMVMMSAAWSAPIVKNEAAGTQTKHPTNPQLATISAPSLDTGDWGGAGVPLEPGALVLLSGFPTAVNNGVRQVTQVLTASTFEIVVPRDATTEALAAAITVTSPAWVDIGIAQRSNTLSKQYTDVPHGAGPGVHSQRYTGAVINGLTLAMTYGEIVTGAFIFLANGYQQETPLLEQQIVTAGGSILPAGTSQPLNASVDMPMATVNGQPTDFCIQALTLEMDNGMTPQTCIGKVAPSKYSLGTASINVTASIYLGDSSYDQFMPAKLTQAPIGMMFAAVNQDGGYGFDLRAVQLSFPDPANEGKDQQVMIEAEGVAKVGPNGSSALRIYKW